MNILNRSRFLAWMRADTTDITNASAFYAVRLTVFRSNFDLGLSQVDSMEKIYPFREYEFLKQLNKIFSYKQYVCNCLGHSVLELRQHSKYTHIMCVCVRTYVHTNAHTGTQTNKQTGLISYCWYNPQPMRNDHSIAGTTILQTTLEDADNTQCYWL